MEEKKHEKKANDNLAPWIAIIIELLSFILDDGLMKKVSIIIIIVLSIHILCNYKTM